MNKNRKKVKELLKQITPTTEELNQKAQALNEKKALQDFENVVNEYDKNQEMIKRAKEGPTCKFFRKVCKHVCNFIYGASICSGVLSAATMGRVAYNSNKKFISTSGYTQQIAKELDADLGLMNNLKFPGMENTQKGVTRLKPNVSNEIYCYIDENVPSNVKKNITDSLDYFNDLFEFINNRYQFKVCNKPKFMLNKLIQESTISFKMQTSEEIGGINTQGLNASKPNKNLISQLVNNVDNVYIVESSIYLNSDAFSMFLNDTEQRMVIKHELMHSLGLGDMYYNDYFNEASIMNAGFDLTDNLSPNDMRLLFTAYHEKLVQNNEIDYAYLKKVKTMLDNYEEWYYKMMFEFCRPALGSDLKTLTTQEVSTTIFQLPTYNEKASMIVNPDGTFVAYYDGVETIGKALVGEEYIVCPNIQTGNGTKCYILTKNKDGKITCKNLISYSNLRVDTELVKDSVNDGLDIIAK